jgi:hypothetical protein
MGGVPFVTVLHGWTDVFLLVDLAANDIPCTIGKFDMNGNELFDGSSSFFATCTILTPRDEKHATSMCNGTRTALKGKGAEGAKGQFILLPGLNNCMPPHPVSPWLTLATCSPAMPPAAIVRRPCAARFGPMISLARQ